VHYRYGEGSKETIGRITGRPLDWTIHYTSISESGGKENSLPIDSNDLKQIALQLFDRWWPDQRKLDAVQLVNSWERYESGKEPDTRQFLTHAIFDVVPRSSPTDDAHLSLDNGIARWEWWEDPAKEYIPPLAFSCTCSLFSVNRLGAAQMLQSREVYDLEARGVPTLSIDPAWKTWSNEFLRTYFSLRKRDRDENAKSEALKRANSSIQLEPQEILNRIIIEPHYRSP